MERKGKREWEAHQHWCTTRNDLLEMLFGRDGRESMTKGMLVLGALGFAEVLQGAVRISFHCVCSRLPVCRAYHTMLLHKLVCIQQSQRLIDRPAYGILVDLH